MKSHYYKGFNRGEFADGEKGNGFKSFLFQMSVEILELILKNGEKC